LSIKKEVKEPGVIDTTFRNTIPNLLNAGERQSGGHLRRGNVNSSVVHHHARSEQPVNANTITLLVFSVVDAERSKAIILIYH
jgi:hypothetical protein